jgi:L-seryl-tRNA(Ser) seleniumtransferase
VTAPQNEKQARFRQLPSVEALLQSAATSALQADFGRPLATEGVRAALADTRQAIQRGAAQDAVEIMDIVSAARSWLESLVGPTLFPVINATGVIVHTNLGRAPLSTAAITAMQEVSVGYSTLEYDIGLGTRGSRSTHVGALVSRISGAEAAMVVNNNAAAILLMLSALCDGREVIISRGQLVEIGGGFRIPEVLAQSGARLVEVGTTNRTHLHDYAQAITPATAAILVVHHSNYQIIGFTSEPAPAELAELAHAHNIALFFDQGSGALLDVTPFGLEAEMTVIDGLQAGADLVAFSGDKLLGGPQAGILAGKAWAIEAVQRHPLARAVRADKLALAALTATLTHYLREEALQEIPVWQMISRSVTDIEETARAWATDLREAGIAAEVVDGRSQIGGGSLPGTSLPTKLVALTYANADVLAAKLRHAEHPLIGRIQDGRVHLDPRTVLPAQADSLLRTIRDVWSDL